MTLVGSHQVLQEEIQQYAETKKNLRRNIKVLRDRVRERILHFYYECVYLKKKVWFNLIAERFILIVSGLLQIKAMMEENESLADMEKLEQQEFNLDVEEQQRLQLEGEQEVTRVNNMNVYRWLEQITYIDIFLEAVVA